MKTLENFVISKAWRLVTPALRGGAAGGGSRGGASRPRPSETFLRRSRVKARKVRPLATFEYLFH